MWEPVGPLPASVYWRRRWLAMASTITVLVLLAWSVAMLIAPTSDGTTSRAAGRAAVSAPQEAGPASVPQPASPPADPAATPPGAPVTTSEELRPDDTPRQSVPVPPPVPVPATGPVPCTNEMLGVAAEIDRPEHRVGERPLLRLVVTNIGDQPCVRDLDSARQEIVVWSEDISTRLWSSNDCANASSVDLRTLVPGRPVAFAVNWAGRTSTPGCAETRTVVPAGNYQVMTRVDDDISAPTPFLRAA